MTTVEPQIRFHRVWSSLAATVLLFIVGIGSLIFFVHQPSTTVIYSKVFDRQSVITVSGNVYDGVEVINRTGLPVPLPRTVALMRAQYRGSGWHVHVYVHRSNIMVTFPHEPAV